jgi:hypothetical protein
MGGGIEDARDRAEEGEEMEHVGVGLCGGWGEIAMRTRFAGRRGRAAMV